MKIIINKKAIETRQEEIIQDIITKAREAADKGLVFFNYTFDYYERRTLNQYIIIGKEIEKRTEGTVVCAYRGDSFTSIKFYIKNV